ncbi:MAG: ABC transporter substrate-binding protein [Chloroflexi bacterium]|nr:ABC transporter substrate-binding protein [Chloroflexota bacterium]
MRMRLLLVVVLLMAAFGTTLTSAQEPVVVEIYFPIAVDSPITAILDEYSAAYEAENAGVDIVFSFEGGYTDVKNKLLTTMEGGGDLPALAIMLATDIYDLRNAEAIVPLDVYASEEYLADFFPTWLSNSYYDYDLDGTPELYGIPFQRSTVLLYTNLTLLEENGLTMPTNWEELATVAQALTTTDRWGILLPNSWPYWVFQPFAIGAGQNIVTESDTDVFFNTPEVVAGLQYWMDLFQTYQATPAGVQSNWGDAPGLFADGKAAMIIHSTGSLPSILGKAVFEVGVSGIPGKDGGYHTVTGGGNLYMVAGTDEATAEAAWKFVEWLTSPAQAVDWSIRTGYITTRISGLELDTWTAYIAENPQAADAAATIDVAGREFSVQSLAAVRDILHAHVFDVLNGVATPEDAMAAAQTEADEALSMFKTE